MKNQLKRSRDTDCIPFLCLTYRSKKEDLNVIEIVLQIGKEHVLKLNLNFT